jgi:hypothetical protein
MSRHQRIWLIGCYVFGALAALPAFGLICWVLFNDG